MTRWSQEVKDPVAERDAGSKCLEITLIGNGVKVELVNK